MTYKTLVYFDKNDKKLIQERMKKMGVSFRTLALLLNLPHAYLFNVLDGKRLVSLETFKDLIVAIETYSPK